jgi:formylglycine-generating enzyme required for sulfatase activity
MKSKEDFRLGRRVLLAAVLFSFTSTVLAVGPVVSNVRSAQRAGTQLVDIDYDLADADSATLTVSIAVSTNGGATYTLPATSLTGALGASVTPGVNKRITWNAGLDWPNKFSANVRFRVTASDDSAPGGMVLIPAGDFTMGNFTDTNGVPSGEFPLHPVYVSAFYMDKYEVTKALWDEVYQWATNHGYSFDNPGTWYNGVYYSKGTNHPVYMINWYDCVKWCNARSEKEGLVLAYYTNAAQITVYRAGQVDVQNDFVKWGAGYRLPTEAEWEKAARGGTSGRRFPWSDTDNITHDRANYYAARDDPYDLSYPAGYHPAFNDGVYPYTSPVGYFAPNGYGLYDMAGNVREWCWDWSVGYPSELQTDPRGPTSGLYRIFRDGAWYEFAWSCRTAYRSSAAPWYGAGHFIGFRCARAAVLAGSSAAQSNITAMDTLVGGIAVSGRVLDSASRSPIGVATVTLAGQNTSSSGAGLFSFASVSLSSGNTLAVSKSGYATYTGTVAAPAGATAVTVPDILLQAAPVENKPVVTSIQAQREGLFLAGIALLNDFTATVDWQGRTPSKIYFYVNGTLAATKTTSGSEATATLGMGLGFSPNFSHGANKLKVVAEDVIGVSSNPYEITVRVIPVPALLTGLPASIVGANEATYSFDVTYPSDKYPVKALQSIPFLGDFGWDLQFIGGYEYALDSGEWTLYAGTQPAKSKGRVGERPHSSLTNPKFYVGNRDIDFGVKLQAEGTATQTGGIVVNEAGVVVFVDVKQELLSFYLTDYVPAAQWVRVLDRLKWLGVDVNSVQRVRVYGLFEGEFQLMLQFQPPPTHFSGADISLELGLEAAYEPDLKVAKMRTYVGGKVKGEFQIPYPSPAFKLKRITGKVYGGISIESWIYDMEEEFVIVQGTLWENTSASPALLAMENQTTTIILPAGHRDFGPRKRDYLKSGSERFVAAQSKLARGKSGKLSTLADFQQIGYASSQNPKAQKTGDSTTPAKSDPVPLDGPIVTLDQADLALVENVFPGSSPAMASKGEELMLLYVADNGSSNTLQCTDIRWTRYDGTNWSTPATIHTNTQAEFAPQVAYDGNGDAIAVWECVADPNFNQTNLPAMAAQMEIVWSKWNHTSGAWSTLAPLTSNG